MGTHNLLAAVLVGITGSHERGSCHVEFDEATRLVPRANAREAACVRLW